MADDDAWMDGGLADDDAGELVPVRGATKAQLAAVTGLTITQLDRLVRDGAPVAKRGASRKEGLRFNVPEFVGWYVERVASRRAAAGAEFVSAKEKAAIALAAIREFELAERQKRVISVDTVRDWMERTCAEFKKGVLDLPSQVASLSSAQRLELEDAARRVLIELSGTKEEFTASNLTPIESGRDQIDDTVNGKAEVSKPEAA